MELLELRQVASVLSLYIDRPSTPLDFAEALDCVATIAKCFDWNEVQEHQERVRGAKVDLEAAGRLAKRLEEWHRYLVSANDLLKLLNARPVPPSIVDQLIPESELDKSSTVSGLLRLRRQLA